MMRWKTWARVSAIILFVIAVAGFYLNNFYEKGPLLEIQNFPSSSDLRLLRNSEDYTFTFSLYNKGDVTAFVDVISVDTQPFIGTSVVPQYLSVEGGKTEDVQVILSALGAETETNITVTIFYADSKFVSKTVQAKWVT